MTYTEEQAKQKLRELVERFRYNLDVYKKSTYNETQVRREFIDPFFEALGWDVSNKQGFAEQYKEVVHEDAIKVGRSTRAPDYSFRIGGQRKFFVEAKKPAVNIKEDVSPSYQLRRYAWSAKLPLSVVTDFEEFSVFDCQIKPNPTDKSGVGRIAYYTFEDYLDKFDEIYDVFSKEAVLKGSFDRYAQSTKGKKGTAEVDSEFLKEIESWRELLAKNIALRNPDMSIYELNYAVQKLLDRIIFLRICEDRGIEPYGQLQTKAESGDVYKHLMNHFKLAESKYNSGIFDFYADKITPTLSIDDRVLKMIIQNLYYPKSPYEFSVLGVEILGNVYEQFLGKVIRLTAGHQAKVETKPEVKKAGGVYYTPQYIVDYIVKNTVGKLVEGKTPEEIAEIKILDPACGSGSFLIGAYTYLLRYHLDWYVNNEPKKHKEAVFQVRENEWHLTTAEKKRILLNNIFGVDIDPQAVEVTKLSLLLKVLEHESRESIDQQVKLGLEGVLPNLEGNIKCGNSLIGPDFYGKGHQEALFDEAEMRQVNVFDWDDDVKGFGRIMRRGGFDCVIGNPPYGMITERDNKAYFEKQYGTPEGRFDKYELFIECGIKLLVKNGFLSYIIPSPLLSNLYARKLRKFLLEKVLIREITNFGMDVFPDPTIHTCIIVLSNVEKYNSNKVKIRKQVKSHTELQLNYDFEIPQQKLGLNKNVTFDIFVDPLSSQLVDKLSSKGVKLGEICFVRQCIKTGNNKIYVCSSDEILPEPWKPTLRGKSITRYFTNEKDLFVKYGPWLARNWKNKTFYETPKIAIREAGNRIIANIDFENRYFLSSLYAIYPKSDENKLSLLYLLGILNSKLATYYVTLIAFNLTKGAFTKVRTNQLARLPIPIINFDDSDEVAQHGKLVALVDSMFELHNKYHEARMDRDKELYERQIKIVDAQIDRLVYNLYGLREEEVKVVEAAF
jgi:type I restriction-modification system DNA methylase subunit